MTTQTEKEYLTLQFVEETDTEPLEERKRRIHKMSVDKINQYFDRDEFLKPSNYITEDLRLFMETELWKISKLDNFTDKELEDKILELMTTLFWFIPSVDPKTYYPKIFGYSKDREPIYSPREVSKIETHYPYPSTDTNFYELRFGKPYYKTSNGYEWDINNLGLNGQ